MKNILILVVLFISLCATSCIKNWECQCIDEDGNVYTETEVVLPKKEAKKACEYYGDDCTLK